MSCVIDLSKWRHAPRTLCHPAGVSLPLSEPGHAEVLIPEVRTAIGDGRHCADLIAALPQMLRAGERVLVLGSGLGVVSTLIAKAHGVARVIVIEPHVALAAYAEEVHELNGVPWVEAVNGVPREGGRGHVPLFVRRDVRASSLVPEDGPWTQVMLVPRLNLDLVLVEEQISAVVVESPAIPAQLLAGAQLGSVARILFGADLLPERTSTRDELSRRLAERGFAAERRGAALSFARAGAARQPGKRRVAG